MTNFIKTNVEADSTQHRLLQRDNEGKLSKDVIDLFASNDMLMLGTNDHLVDSISNFRPAIKSENKLPLYLSRKYSDILYSFLGNRHSPMGKDGIMKPAYSKRKSAKREAFLERYIKIWQGHWGGFWLLHSYPTATSITFDQNREFARVDFTMVYEGGEAILKKEQGNWVLVSAYRIWIE